MSDHSEDRPLAKAIAAVLREHLLGVVGGQGVPEDEFDCCADAILAMPQMQVLRFAGPSMDPVDWTHYHPYDDPDECDISSSRCGGKRP